MEKPLKKFPTNPNILKKEKVGYYQKTLTEQLSQGLVVRNLALQ